MSMLNLLNTMVPVLQASDPIEKAIDLFRNQNIHAAPVMENGQLTGIITLVSVYQFLSRPGHYASCPVEWVMVKPPVTLPLSANVSDAAKMMVENHVFTLPVLDGEDIAGLVSVEKLLESLIKD